MKLEKKFEVYKKIIIEFIFSYFIYSKSVMAFGQKGFEVVALASPSEEYLLLFSLFYNSSLILFIITGILAVKNWLNNKKTEGESGNRKIVVILLVVALILCLISHILCLCEMSYWEPWLFYSTERMEAMIRTNIFFWFIVVLLFKLLLQQKLSKIVTTVLLIILPTLYIASPYIARFIWSR